MTTLSKMKMTNFHTILQVIITIILLTILVTKVIKITKIVPSLLNKVISITNRKIYSVMYSYYMWRHDLHGIATNVRHEQHDEQSHEKCEKYNAFWQLCPHLMKLYYILGLWNSILFIIFNFFAGILLKTPVEIQLINDSKSQYFPAKRQWKIVKWTKNKL